MGRIEVRNESFTRIVELTPDLRRQIENTVERLLQILDAYDGDPDLESGNDDEDEEQE